MKKYFFIFFVFAVSFNSAVYSQNANTIREDFNVFFKKFNSDAKFQTDRVIFPIKYKMLDDDFNSANYIMTKAQFKVLNLNNKADEKNYKTKIVLAKNKATIQQRGIDNGTFTDYIFELRNNKWFLITWIDEST